MMLQLTDNSLICEGGSVQLLPSRTTGVDKVYHIRINKPFQSSKRNKDMMSVTTESLNATNITQTNLKPVYKQVNCSVFKFNTDQQPFLT
jgi:hypothetical protein